MATGASRLAARARARACPPRLPGRSRSLAALDPLIKLAPTHPRSHAPPLPREMSLEAIKYTGTDLQVLDQLLLPLETSYISVKNVEDGHRVIKNMNVRGAPAIAIVGAIAIAVDAAANGPAKIRENCDYLLTSRPTAVNLSKAMAEIKQLDQTPEAVKEYALEMLRKDIETNKAIGDYGAQWIEPAGKTGVITICNTGSLATAGYGTALGVVRSIHAAGRLDQVYPLETRPYNQGARLTAYELVHDQIPSTLVTDSMAAALLRAKSIGLAVVGADRVAPNGDTANKIGTFQLAVLCRHFGVKFAVAAPTTSIDLATSTGDKIVIEERPQDELTHINGSRIAAPGINVWNPAFDVTPFDLIDAIITEKGVVEKTNGVFDLAPLFS